MTKIMKREFLSIPFCYPYFSDKFIDWIKLLCTNFIYWFQELCSWMKHYIMNTLSTLAVFFFFPGSFFVLSSIFFLIFNLFFVSVWVLKNIDLFGTIRKKQKVKWNPKKKLRRKKMRWLIYLTDRRSYQLVLILWVCVTRGFTGTTSLWTDLLAIGLNAWQKRKGAQGVIEIENPNLVKPKNVKARDLDVSPLRSWF